MNEKKDENEAAENLYNQEFGNDVVAFLEGTFDKITKTHNADSLLFFYQQLKNTTGQLEGVFKDMKIITRDNLS